MRQALIQAGQLPDDKKDALAVLHHACDLVEQNWPEPESAGLHRLHRPHKLRSV